MGRRVTTCARLAQSRCTKANEELMEEKNTYDADVVVIGAGPAGSTVAQEIAKEGYSILLIEKDAYPGKCNVCAGVLDNVCAKSLNLTEEIIQKKIPKSILYFPWLTYIDDTTPYVSVQRNVFDRFLARKAVSEGAKLLVSTLASDIILSQDGIVVSLKNLMTGEHYKLKAKLAIFADGSHTLAFKKFKGIGFGGKNRKAFSAIYELEWRDNPFEYFEVFFDTKVSPWGYGWIFPKRDLLNVGVMCLMRMMRSNIRTHLDFLVNRHPIASKKLRGRKKLKFAADIIPLQYAKRICGDRTLVVGDAAGMVDPIWGAGIENAIEGSMLAARVAVRALEKNTFDETFLSQFGRDWKRGKTYKSIRMRQLLSGLFLTYSKLDKNAYIWLQMLLNWRFNLI